MAAPSYVNASTGGTDAGGAWTHTSAAPGAAGRLLILHVFQDGTSSATAIGISSATNCENLAGTDNVVDKIGDYPTGSVATPTGYHHLFVCRSLSTSAVVFTGTNSGTDDVYFRCYEFQNVSAGTTLAAILENSTAGTVASDAGTSTSVTDVGVTTRGPDRLALNFIAVADEIQAGELTSMTGESNGDWTYPVAAFGSATGTDGTLAVVNASLATATTINGGSDTITSEAWGVAGFALVGTTAMQTSVARVSLAAGSTPTVRTGHAIKATARTTALAGTLRAALYEGANNRSGDLESTALTTSLADYSLAISEANATNIVDYSDLEIRFWGYSATSQPTVFEVDKLCLEIPEAGERQPRYGFVSFQDPGVL